MDNFVIYLVDRTFSELEKNEPDLSASHQYGWNSKPKVSSEKHKFQNVINLLYKC